MMEETSMVPAAETQAGVSEFDYSLVPLEIADTLMRCEVQIRQVVTHTATELGRLFKTAQETLVDHGGGLFETWINAMGYKKRTAYRLIERYNLVNLHNGYQHFNIGCATVAQPTQQDFAARVESLPLTLSYEISSPSAPPELVAKVLNGEICTLAEYRKHLKASKKPNGWLELAGSNLPKIGSVQAAAKLANAYKQQCEAIPDTLRYALTGLPLEEIKPVLWDAIYAARDAANVLEQTLVRMENDIKGGINF